MLMPFRSQMNDRAREQRYASAVEIKVPRACEDSTKSGIKEYIPQYTPSIEEVISMAIDQLEVNDSVRICKGYWWNTY